jgi:hypothetical protein
MSSVSFSTKKKITTFRRKIELAIPPEKPELRGYIEVDFKTKTKPEVKALGEQGLTDEELLPEICEAIHGLGHHETDELLTGDAAFKEALEGPFSMYIPPAIVEDYFAQYAQARRGNSRRPR